MKHYYHVLTKEETEALFLDLEKVLARVLLLEVHNKKLRRKIAKRGTARKSSAMKDTSSRLELGQNAMMTTTEDLLGGTNAKGE